MKWNIFLIHFYSIWKRNRFQIRFKKTRNRKRERKRETELHFCGCRHSSPRLEKITHRLSERVAPLAIGWLNWGLPQTPRHHSAVMYEGLQKGPQPGSHGAERRQTLGVVLPVWRREWKWTARTICDTNGLLILLIIIIF